MTASAVSAARSAPSGNGRNTMLSQDARDRAVAVVGAIVALAGLVLGLLAGAWRKRDDR